MSTEKLNFEESLKRLEAITKLLESSETPLEESLKLFEEGAGLVRALTGALDEATRRVTMLVDTDKETPSEVDFVEGDK